MEVYSTARKTKRDRELVAMPLEYSVTNDKWPVNRDPLMYGMVHGTNPVLNVPNVCQNDFLKLKEMQCSKRFLNSLSHPT